MNIDNSVGAPEYAEIFDIRGSLYHNSMVSWPSARDKEFSSLFSKVNLTAGESLVDVPSGGGYLGTFLKREMPSSDIFVQNLELTSGFGDKSTVVSLDSAWPISLKSFDRVICLAAAHHIYDLSPLYLKVESALKSGGIFHLADVAPGSGVELFLENFVHNHTSGGHRGFYRDLFSQSYPSNFNVIDISIRSCPWHFKNVESMTSFCGGLFGLQNYSKIDLEASLRDYIGVETHSTGISLSWELAYLDMRLK